MGIQSVASSKKKITFIHGAIGLAASVVGAVAVLYAHFMEWAQKTYFHFYKSYPGWISIASPFLFVIATGIVKYFAEEAKGSGIPQVLESIELAKKTNGDQAVWANRLVSLRTAIVKIISTGFGVFGGASIGREGPTVQIAASGFAWFGKQIRKKYSDINFPSFLTAGAAAGVAAAFNTPLAGITFAMEEIAEGFFGPLREPLILGVVVAGIVAQGLAGDYLYFGHPTLRREGFLYLLFHAVTIGTLCGLLGGVFARCLISQSKILLSQKWWLRSFILGVFCSLIGWFTHGDTAGSGYEITRKSLESLGTETPGLLFPFLKFLTTVFSYLSGMAGGIFSPCLSIGAGFGFSFASLAQISNVKACALLGMVAFFSGVVQAPLTAVVIVTEMTDEHQLILPFMAAAFIAQAWGKWLMPVPLYKWIASIKSSSKI